MTGLEVAKKFQSVAGAIITLILLGFMVQSPAFAQPDAEYRQIVNVVPVYPAGALERRLSGWVIVDYTITERGSVEEVTVVRSTSSVFENAALESARKYRFEPRVENGRAVPTRGVRSLIRFELEAAGQHSE
jgi:protein TonB